MQILDKSDSPGKAVVIVSDGEDHSSAALRSAAELDDAGIVIFSAGVGTQKAQLFP
jgi:hypothetical protein